MGNLSKGVTFSDGDTVTAAKLNNLVDNATISNVQAADLASGIGVIVVQGSVPSSPSQGDAWFQTIGATFGVLRVYDGSQWVPLAQGVLGYNSGGAQADQGDAVKYDSSGTLGDSRIPIAQISSRDDEIFGVVAEDIAAGSTGVVITTGYVPTLKEDGTGSPAAGHFIAAGDTTDGEVVSNSTSYYGNVPGNSPGVFLETPTSQVGAALLFGPGLGRGSVVLAKTPSTIFDAALMPGQGDSWVGMSNFQETVPGTIGRIVRFKLRQTAATAGDTVAAGVAFRMNGESVSPEDSANLTSGAFLKDGGTEDDVQCLAGTAIIPGRPASPDDRAEFYVALLSAETDTNYWLTVYEIGAIVGGQVN